MRATAREAALNIVFAQQFNTDCLDVLKKKVFKQFKLEKEEDVLFALDLVAAVEEHRQVETPPILPTRPRIKPRIRLRIRPKI